MTPTPEVVEACAKADVHLRLYHFSARHMADAIMREGITRGFVLVDFGPPIRMCHDYRWLTTNANWDQSWSEGTGRLKYRRNESRLMIDIPMSESHRISPWKQIGPLISREYETLSAFGDPENWRLFRGNIPREWIVLRSENPNYGPSAIAEYIRQTGVELPKENA